MSSSRSQLEEMGRLPAAKEYEKGLLSSILHENSNLTIARSAGLKAEHFRSLDHNHQFALMCRMQDNNTPIDMVTYMDAVSNRDDCGSVVDAIELGDYAIAAINVDVYARRIMETAAQRSMYYAAREIIDMVTPRAPEDHQEFISDALAKITAIVDESAEVTEWTDHRQSGLDFLEDLEARYESGETMGRSTGIRALDERMSGLRPGQLVVLAARPGMGKTALALRAVVEACRAGYDALVFSMEMTQRELSGRIYCQEALVDAAKTTRADLDQEDWDALLATKDQIQAWPGTYHVCDRPGLSISDVSARARTMAAKSGNLGIIVIDYLQLMSGSDKRAPREQQISEISRNLKTLAKDLGVPVIALSQLNRSCESRADKRPMCSDLRESGAIEQDADVVLFIYRDEVYNPGCKDGHIAELIIGKQRAGSTGTVRCAWRGEYTLFEDLQPGAGPLQF